MSEQESGLVLNGLTKVLGGRVIIDDLHLEVKKGEMVSLLGPSGCGKTTTLRMIAGFLIPDKGDISLAGNDVTLLGPEKRPSAMVFQNYALWPHMTVFKNVAYPLKVRKLGKEDIEKRVNDALGLVNLMHHQDSRPSQISGGEQQRVALARALVQEPDILLLDEPTSALDVSVQAEILNLLARLRQTYSLTSILVSHDLAVVAHLCTRIAVMQFGQVVEVISAQDLRRGKARETYTQQLIAASRGFTRTQ